MHGNVTDQEWEIFRQAFLFFKTFCAPPANQDEHAVTWWSRAAQSVGELSAQWHNHMLMDELLVAIYNYIGHKADKKSTEAANHV